MALSAGLFAQLILGYLLIAVRQSARWFAAKALRYLLPRGKWISSKARCLAPSSLWA